MGVSLSKTPPPTPGAARSPDPHRLRSKKWLPLVIGSTIFLVMLAAWYVKVQRTQESAGIQAASWAALEEYKVDQLMNKSGMPKDLISEARKAVTLDASNKSKGLLALVSVWEHRWHFRTAKWRNSLYQEDAKLTEDAIKGEPTPAGLLARAWLFSNACVLMPRTDRRRMSVCNEAMNMYTRSRKALETDKRKWLHFEGLWTEAQFLNRYLARFPEDEAVTTKLLIRMEKVCDEGWTVLDSSPVNDIELAYQCSLGSSSSGNWTDYIKWVNVHMERGRTASGLSERSVTAAFVSASPKCRKLATSKRHRLKNQLPIPYQINSAVHGFCTAAGYAGVGCFEFGIDLWKRYASTGEGGDWDGLKRGLYEYLPTVRDDVTQCVYTGEAHDRSRLYALVADAVPLKDQASRVASAARRVSKVGTETSTNPSQGRVKTAVQQPKIVTDCISLGMKGEEPGDRHYEANKAHTIKTCKHSTGCAAAIVHNSRQCDRQVAMMGGCWEVASLAASIDGDCP